MPDEKRRRQALLAELIRGGRFRTQDELAEELTRRGLAATAATVSRDLKALGYVKTVGGGYHRPDAAPPSTGNGSASAESEARLRRLLADVPITVDQAGHLLVIRTLPGYAHSLASGIDGCGWPEVVGTVAGDDTIFVALRDPAHAEIMRRRFDTARGPR